MDADELCQFNPSVFWGQKRSSIQLGSFGNHTAILRHIDYFWFEEGILVSRDIVHEGLGFNISMQFLMIPFTFCTQTRYVATTGYTSSWITLLGIFIIYGTCNYVLQWNLLPAKNFQTSNNRPLIFVLFCKRNWILDLQSQ